MFLFFALPEEGASWLQKLEHLKYILAYFITLCLDAKSWKNIFQNLQHTPLAQCNVDVPSSLLGDISWPFLKHMHISESSSLEQRKSSITSSGAGSYYHNSAGSGIHA
jgi:hypothetical protein